MSWIDQTVDFLTEQTLIGHYLCVCESVSVLMSDVCLWEYFGCKCVLNLISRSRRFFFLVTGFGTVFIPEVAPLELGPGRLKIVQKLCPT